MIAALIFISVIVVVLCVVYCYHRDIENGKCPMCGEDIKTITDDMHAGDYCPHCGWYELADE